MEFPFKPTQKTRNQEKKWKTNSKTEVNQKMPCISKLPKNPVKGKTYQMKHGKRKITYKATGKPKLKYKIVKNEKA